MRPHYSIFFIALTLAFGCGQATTDDDDSSNAVDDDDDDDTSDDDDSSNAVDDDDSVGPDDYPGLPAGLSAGMDWVEELDAGGDEVYTDLLITDFAPPELPWDAASTQDLGAAGAAMTLNTLTGAISSIAADTWDGDKDAYQVFFPEGGFLHFVLDWDKEAGDYDAMLFCEFQDDNNDYGIYDLDMTPSIADVSKPEGGITTVPIYDGTRCFFFVVGYSGGGVGYTIELATDGASAGPAPWGVVGDDDDSAAVGDDDDSAAVGDDDDSAAR